MLCERPYAAPATLCLDAPQCSPSLAHADPEDACAFCEGRGFVRHRGRLRQMCGICEGVSTAGVFVVQTVTTRFVHEITFQARSMVAARRRADIRALAIVRAGGLCLGYRVEAVNVVYKSLDTPSGDEIVATVPLVAPAPVAA